MFATRCIVEKEDEVNGRVAFFNPWFNGTASLGIWNQVVVRLGFMRIIICYRVVYMHGCFSFESVCLCSSVDRHETLKRSGMFQLPLSYHSRPTVTSYILQQGLRDGDQTQSS
ncbi:hypothetical protein AWENTII_001612 [Aspergillus wentii]